MNTGLEIWAKSTPLILLLAVLCTGCHGDPSARTEDVTIWQPRGHWSGRELLQTEPFISTSGLLRLTWQSRSVRSDAPGTLRIVLHSDVSGRPLAAVLEHRGPGSGVRYVTEDPRSFFLVIEPTDAEWKVEVAEGVAGKVEQ